MAERGEPGLNAAQRDLAAEAAARALAAPEAERALIIERICGGDEAARREALDLVARAGTLPSQFLEGSPTLGDLGVGIQEGSAAALREGERVGRFRLLEKIGEGGFGVVYRAAQTEPVRREVALKVIKPGMDSAAVVARFEAERQALAVMDHPGVARVFDGGVTDRGAPYFVMELVRGERITRFCDMHRLGLPERIRLFVQVCEAVQHAHTKGIIHRDLKPSNILVAYDAEGRARAKVIDFGVAKALHEQPGGGTVFTAQGQMIGTPEYMSPEQAEMGGLDIDARSDVYSLGVVLYELLVGGPPFDPRSLREAGLLEIRRIIREQEPARPSTKLASAGGSSTTIAEARRADPRSLSSVLRGELDWVVMKCLEKDRARRYETPNSLAVELERYLGNEAVLARPPSAGYRLRKFVRRRRGPVAAGAAMLLLLVGGIAGTSLFAVRAQAAAALAAAEAEKARAAEAAAETRAQELEEVASFQESQLSGIDTPLMGIRLREAIENARRDAAARGGAPPEEVEKAVVVLEAALDGVNFTDIALGSLKENIFDRALAAIEEEFEDRPLIRARLLRTVGSVLFNLGLYSPAEDAARQAVQVFRQSVGAEHRLTLKAASDLHVMRWKRGALREAESAVRDLLEIERRVLGEGDEETIATMLLLGTILGDLGELAEAERQIRAAHDASVRAKGGGADRASFLNALGVVLAKGERLSEAEEAYRGALAIETSSGGETNARELGVRANLALTLKRAGKLDEADSLLRETLESQRRSLGADHPAALLTLRLIAALARERGRLEESEMLYAEALARDQESHGSGRAELLEGHADTLRMLGRHDEAELSYRQALALVRDISPARVASVRGKLGLLYWERRRLPEAETELRAALREAPDPSSLQLGSSELALGMVLRDQGKLEEAEPLLRGGVEQLRKVKGDRHPETARAVNSLGVLLRRREDYAGAEACYRAALAVYHEVLGDRHPETLACTNNLAISLRRQGEVEEAEELYRRVIETRRSEAHRDAAESLNVLANLIALLESQSRSEEAEPLYVESLALAVDRFGPDDHRSAGPRVGLGRIEIARGRLAEAQSHLLEALRVLGELRGSPSRVRRNCYTALADLYTAWHAAEPGAGHDAKAAEWKAKLETLSAPAAPE